MKVHITEEFDRALTLINAGENVLISGRAGTGKSTLLRMFLDSATGKNILITAPTGVAALNIGGFTIHKAFGFRPGLYPDDVRPGGRWSPPANLLEVLAKADVLVVDEISMVRADIFDMMDGALRRARGVEKPFGGIQLVLVGDLLQLPPVVTESEAELFHTRWEGPFFFHAHCYPQINLQEINLSTVWRQSDSEFVDLLNEVREGSVGEDSLALLNTKVDPDFLPPAGWVTITSRKKTVTQINAEHLDTLPGPHLVSVARQDGDVDISAFGGEPELRYAVGARVMTIINDPLGRFVNGSFGEIVAANPTEVTIRIDDTGQQVTVKPHTWEIRRPTVVAGRLGSEATGSVTQFPFILAWVITIHKAQGKTIPKLFINLKGGTTTDGQFYVALSRAVELEHVRLSQPVKPQHIRANNALVRKIRRGVSTQVAARRIVLLSFDGVNFGRSEHVIRILAIIYQDGARVANFGTWINPGSDLGEFGVANNVPSGGLAMAPSLGDFWPLLLRQAQGGIVVGDRLDLVERAVRHQEKGLVLGLGVGYDAGDFSVTLSGTDVATRCEELARAYEAGQIRPVKGAPVPQAALDTEGAVYQPTWAPRFPMQLDPAQATNSDHAWAAMNGGVVPHVDPAEVDECAELFAAWAVNRGAWTEDLRQDIEDRVRRIGATPPQLPQVQRDAHDLSALLVKGTRVAFTGSRTILGEAASDEQLEQICAAKGLEYKRSMSRTKCDVLVATDIASMSRKAQAARQFGKPIILHEDFEEWFARGPAQSVPDQPEPEQHTKKEEAPLIFGDPEQHLRPGARVAFRGTVVLNGKEYLQGPELEELCTHLGIEYKQAVSKTRCDVVVTDDVDVIDGKMELARRYGKPVIVADDFEQWAREELGLEDGEVFDPHRAEREGQQLLEEARQLKLRAMGYEPAPQQPPAPRPVQPAPHAQRPPTMPQQPGMPPQPQPGRPAQFAPPGVVPQRPATAAQRPQGTNKGGDAARYAMYAAISLGIISVLIFVFILIGADALGGLSILLWIVNAIALMVLGIVALVEKLR